MTLRLLVTFAGAAALFAAPDWRDIRQGREIPTETYSDQPYVVKTDDGAWLVCVTTGAGREGQAGQHVITMRSTDQGRTWSAPVDVEPAQGPESSYAVMLKVPSGRVYIFYNHNTGNVRKVIADNPPYKDGFNYRVDAWAISCSSTATITAAPGPRNATTFPSATSRSTGRTSTAAS